MALKRNRDHDALPPTPSDDDQVIVTSKERHINRELFATDAMCDLRIEVRIPRADGSERLSVYFFNSSLLAASSPVLYKRLHGPMAEQGLLDLPRSERVLKITGDQNHVHFHKLLDFVEGSSIFFDSKEAPMIFMLAEFYEVRGLSAACEEHWFQALEPSSCCTLMGIAKAVNCVALEGWCYDLLILGFEKVLERDEAFGTLDAESLLYIGKLNSLVVSNEAAFVYALLTWFAAGAGGDLRAREEQLTKMLVECVRWDRVLCADVGPKGDGPAYDHGYSLEHDAFDLRTGHVYHQIWQAVVTAYDCRGKTKRTRCDPDVQKKRDEREKLRNMADEAEARLRALVTECLENTRFLYRVPGETKSPSLKLASPFRLNTNPRQYAWGSLRAQNPPAPNPQTYPETGGHIRLCKDKVYLIGRSSTADIRIPVSTVSARHFTVSTKVVWDHDMDLTMQLPVVGAAHDEYGLDCKADREKSTARLVPYITGLSQSNGTFLDGRRLTVNDSEPLKWDSMIQLVGPDIDGLPEPPHFIWTRPEWDLRDDYEKAPWEAHVMTPYVTKEEDKQERARLWAERGNAEQA
jgi:hypothetical protein